MLPDFESAIVGMKAGETNTFPLTFPQDYNEALKGKTADFTVTVNQVAEAQLPPVDAEFARQLGVASGDVEQLRREVRQNVEAELTKRIKSTIKEQVMDAMYTSAAFEVPRSLLENEIQRMQQQAVDDLKQRAKYNNVDRAAMNGDLANIDFEGLIAGQPFEGNKAANFTVILGEARMLPDFESAIVGMKAGETKTFPLTFPQDYNEALKGKTADFTVIVNQVAEADLPPVDAEFARQLGVASGDVEQLRREVRQNVEAEVAKRIKSTIKEQVMDAMYASAAFEVPRSLLENEIQRLPLPPQLFTDRAARRIKVGLVVAELVNRNNLQAKPDQVRKIIEEHAQSFEQPEQLVRWYYADPARLAEVEALAMEDNVVEWALGQVGVVDEKMSFDDLMGTKKG